MKQLFKPMAAVLGTMLFAFMIAACGSSPTATPATGGTGTTGTVGLVAQGIDTTTTAHATWVATAPHNAFTCMECHTVDREKVCSQSGCHPFSKYTALATNFDHTAAITGDQCNKCHGLTPEPTATDAVRIAGWRENMLIPGIKWHTDLKGVCLNCHDPVQHSPFNLSVFPVSHQTDTTRQTACESCHFYKLNAAGTAGTWGGAAHPTVTTGCAGATCHTHSSSTAETHYQGGTAPAGQHYNANTGGPFNCEWCHAETITGNYVSWAVTFDKTTHQQWNSGACKACHPNGITHPAVATGCRTATCHTHTKPATQLHQASTNYTGHHYDANPSGPFECEWCHQGVATGGYTSWSLPFSKHSHQNWSNSACTACHSSIPN